MTKVSFFFFLFLLFSCGNQETKSNNEANSKESTHIAASISIPQGSGFAIVSYKEFVIENSNFYEIINKPDININIDSTEMENDGWSIESDTLATYPVSIEHQIKLKNLITKTDSLGSHIADGCTDFFGWPRFFIGAILKNKNLDGFIAKCYRQHIFEFVDLLNECYPKGDALSYDKDELLALERRCNENNYRNDK